MKLTACSLKRQTKLINLQSDSSRKKERGPKSIKSEMKNEKLQLAPQKYILAGYGHRQGPDCSLTRPFLRAMFAVSNLEG